MVSEGEPSPDHHGRPLRTLRWADVAGDDPDLAFAVYRLLTRTRHHVLATLRADGSPRVSGTEVQFFGADLVAGCMPGSVKERDLARDGRYALHANPGDGTMDEGDAKLSGWAELVRDPVVLDAYAASLEERPPGPFTLIRFGIAQVVLTRLHPDGDRLVISSWRPGRGTVVTERS